MNMLFITHFFVGFMFMKYREYPYSFTFPYKYLKMIYK